VAEVAVRGEALVEEVRAAQPEPGRGYFWWLGQHSFILKLGTITLYIDPYLAPDEARQTPPLLAPEQVTNADLVLCTHDHGDHMDPYAITGILKASPQALFVAPRAHRQRMIGIGVPGLRLWLINDGQPLRFRDAIITGVKGKHEFFHETPDGFPYLGYVVAANGVTCYHSGDTLVYDGLLATLRRWQLDVAFLPINGRDADRFRDGCIGNMSYQEAVELAGDLRVGLAVPAHWDMFAHNSEDPRKFVDYLAAKYPEVPAWVGRAGERVLFGRS
jgi:L-ascorbate 6-phosphate lactonase